MSFRDCIQTAIDTGRVSAKKGAEALAAYDEAFTRASATEPEGVADTIAANAALKDITTLKAAKRHERINTMQRGHEIYERLINAKDPARELQEIVIDMELAQETVRSVTMANLDRLMLKFGPKMGGIKIPKAGMDDVVRAAYGDVRSKEAKELADAVIEARETLRKEANMYGASIPENANAKLMQMHDSVKVGKVLQDEWVKDHLRNLDWDVMRFAGKEIPVDKREEILGNTYRGIINDGFDRGDVAQLHAPGLASRLNRDRFLYYKDADAYLEMQEKYGAGNFYEQTINMVEAMAKDISILRVFGPSADSMKEYTKRVALRRTADLNDARPAGKKNLTKKMEKQVALFEREYLIHAWHVTSADGNLAVQTFSTLKTISVNALLGMSFIPNFFGDLANARVARSMFNLPEISVFRSYPREFFAGKRGRSEVAQLGVIMEDAISLVQARLRYFGALDGPHWARRIGDMTYRLGLASLHTQAARNAQGKQIMGVFANYADKKFEDLPFMPLLLERNITAADWDAFRATPVKDVRGAKFLTPIDMHRAGDEAAKKIASKFSDVVQLYIRTAVPDVTLRGRAAMGEAIDPNTVAGQAVRSMTSLISFPVSIWFNQLQRIAAAPGIRNKMTLGAKYFTWMTLAGAAITQTKAIVNGQNLYDMTLTDDEGHINDFWGRAIVNGGSFGILGDFVFDSINMNNSPQYGGTPITNYLQKFHKLTLDNMIDAGQTALYNRGMVDKPGDDLNVSADVLNFIDANVPDLWQIKLLFNRAIKDEFMQIADPAAWQRKQKYLQENTPQGMWWEAGGEPTPPRLETAVGG